jgi:hypothetical protein
VSVEALTWLAQRAPGVKPHWLGTLFGLCNHADDEGKGSRPSQGLLAWYARKTERAVREDLAAMEEAGLIRKGDQRLVAHLPADKRPVVWDLAMERDRGPRPRPGKPGRPAKNRAEPQHPPISDDDVSAGQKRGGLQFPPESERENGGNPSVNRGEPHCRQTVLDPSVEPSSLPLGEGAAAEPGDDAEPPTELTAEELALAAELTAAAPRWSPVSIRATLADPAIRERVDRPLVRLAFLLAAADRQTRTPRRLLHDACPHWARAERELYPDPDAGEPAELPLLGPVPWCGDPGCDQTTRTAVDPDTGNPRPGRPRCPRCHPQSPRTGAA